MRNLLSILYFLSVIISIRAIPLIIGHRGASGHRPENTLPSWEAAINFGSDYVEIDLASTKDHVLVASHNPDITHTTDVGEHPEYASRYTTKNISGEIYEGYFVDDFTISELKTLRIRERYSFRSQTWNGLYSIATLQEFLMLVRAKESELGKRIGIYLETKHPSYYRSIGLPLEEILVSTLHDFGYQSESDPVFIESFEGNLKDLRTITKLPLVQLISGSEGDKAQFDTQRRWTSFITEEGLKEVASYAQAIAPHKSVIYEIQDGAPVSTSFIRRAHSAGLQVHVWSFRKEREHFEKHEKRLFSTVEEEMQAFFDLDVDAIFADQPDIGVQVKNTMSLVSNKATTLRDYVISLSFSVLAIIGLFQLSKSTRRYKVMKVPMSPHFCKKDQSNSF